VSVTRVERHLQEKPAPQSAPRRSSGCGGRSGLPPRAGHRSRRFVQPPRGGKHGTDRSVARRKGGMALSDKRIRASTSAALKSVGRASASPNIRRFDATRRALRKGATMRSVRSFYNRHGD